MRDYCHIAEMGLLGLTILELRFESTNIGVFPQGGILTPAAGLGEALIERLRKAGMSFEIEEASNAGNRQNQTKVKAK